MIEIKNKFIPVKGFGAMNILGLLFVREEHKLTDTTYRHEAIHTQQQYELLVVAALLSLLACNIWASWWYLLGSILLPLAVYVLAWIVELALPPYKTAYKDSPFEREANASEHNPEYLARRHFFAWVRYILSWDERGLHNSFGLPTFVAYKGVRNADKKGENAK